MRIKALLAALLCTAVGVPVVVMGFGFDPPIWEAVVIGALAAVTGPVMAGLVFRDLTRSRKGVASEAAGTALDVFKP